MLLRRLNPVSRTALREDLMRHIDNEDHIGMVFSLEGALLILRLSSVVSCLERVTRRVIMR